MATERTYGFDDIYTRGRDYGPVGGRKRKTYDRDLDTDFDLGRRRFGGGLFDRGLLEPTFDRFGYSPFDYTPGFDYGFGRGGGFDTFGYPALTYPGGGRFGLQQPQAIGEAGYDLGITGRRRADETKYRNLRDWNRVEENPNIDELTLWRPRADIFDLGLGALRVEFEIPGVPREDISLTVRDDTITLTALKPQSRKEEAGFHYQSERHFGKFYRRLALPFAVDPNSVRAYLELGVLKVHLNKAEGTERIQIREGGIPIEGGTTGAMGESTGTSAGTTSSVRT
jgi:HSP20 family protein